MWHPPRCLVDGGLRRTGTIGTGAAPIQDGVLVVKGRLIAAVGPRGLVTVPADAEVVDVAHVAYDPVPEAVLEMMVMKKIVLVPTFTVFRNYNAPVDVCIDNLRRHVNKGGSVALGNDYGGGPGSYEAGIPFYELTCMLEAGMSSMGVLVACTRNAAQVSHVDSILGTLEAGKIADVLVVKGDPLADLNALSRMRLVIHDGVNIRAERP